MPKGIYLRTTQGFQKGNIVRLGIPTSEVTKEKIRQALKGRTFSEEHRKKIGNSQIGRILSDTSRAKISKANKGKNSGNWKGGKRKKLDGYIAVLIPEHPLANCDGCVAEHRLVMEKKLGRYLLPKEEIHHINAIRDDNRIENLILFANRAEHIKFHREEEQRIKKCQTNMQSI